MCKYDKRRSTAGQSSISINVTRLKCRRLGKRWFIRYLMSHIFILPRHHVLHSDGSVDILCHPVVNVRDLVSEHEMYRWFKSRWPPALYFIQPYRPIISCWWSHRTDTNQTDAMKRIITFTFTHGHRYECISCSHIREGDNQLLVCWQKFECLTRKMFVAENVQNQ